MNFDTLVDKLADLIVKSTREIVMIPSVEAPALPGMPFGKEINNALDYALELGSSMGFRTKNLDGYIGYIEFGEGRELIGILAHLDVVPEGQGWTYPPYAAEIHDGKIFGRGAIDDKGPAMAALYAMKAVKDSGVAINKRIRLILGLDEESGWECMKHYKEVEEIPNCAFTPDADYPVIHAEKGIVNYKFSQSMNSSSSKIKIVAIKGGNRPNMVPDYCKADIQVAPELLDNLSRRLAETIRDNGFKIELAHTKNTITLESFGKSSHGSLPHKGINAVSQLLVTLYSCMKELDEENSFITFYNSLIGIETDGNSMGIKMSDDVSGELTFNIGLIDMNTDHAEAVTNIRYPVTFKEEMLREKIESVLQPYGIGLEKTDDQPPLYVPKDHPLVQKLMKVYREYTGDDREPVAIGGGTYARAMSNAVAFGAAFPGEPELAHEKDEYISIDSLIKNTKIYASAIYELTL